MHIDAEVATRFSAEAQFRALGGFLFLRMVCPALLAPQVFGLLDAPPHPVRPLSPPHPPRRRHRTSKLSAHAWRRVPI
jgi:hypothetical protein